MEQEGRTDMGRPVDCTYFPGGIKNKGIVKHERGRGGSGHKKEKCEVFIPESGNALIMKMSWAGVKAPQGL